MLTIIVTAYDKNLANEKPNKEFYEMSFLFLKKKTMEGSKDVSLLLVLSVEVLCSDVIPGAAAVISYGGSAETFDNWQVGMMKKILTLLIY